MKIFKTITIISILQFVFVIIVAFFNSRATLAFLEIKNKSLVSQNSVVLNNSNSKDSPIIQKSVKSVVHAQKKETTNNRCLIKIDANVYDLTDFISVHSGGNTFQCGTDMTKVFYERHSSSYLALLTKYKV